MNPPVVLIPLDGSREAEYALADAEAVARSRGLCLRLLGVVDPTPAAGAAAPAPSLNFAVLQRREELEAYLHHMARSLQQRGIMTEVVVLCDAPEPALRAAVGAPEVVLTVLAAPAAEGKAPTPDLEQLVRELAVGAVLVVQPQLQPASG